MLPYAEITIRTVVIFVGVVIGSKLIGQPFKVLSGVVLAVMAGWAACDRTNTVYYELLAMAVWVLLSVLVSLWALTSTPVRNFVNGKATPLIQNGRVLEQNLRKSRMTVNDMMSLLRKKSAFKLADVEFASLEGDGTVSVLLKSDSQPTTPRVQHLSVENEPAPVTVVVDGEVLPDSLANLGFDRAWLLEQIRAKGASDWQDVFVAQVDAKGNVYVDLYDDLMARVESRGNPKPQILAALKKAQADMEAFALQTQNAGAKANYERHARSLQQMIDKLSPHLRK